VAVPLQRVEVIQDRIKTVLFTGPLGGLLYVLYPAIDVVAGNDQIA
jgi:hypothetical protein